MKHISTDKRVFAYVTATLKIKLHFDTKVHRITDLRTHTRAYYALLSRLVTVTAVLFAKLTTITVMLSSEPR